MDWTKKETKELDCWTRKQLIVGRAIHPKSNGMRIYIKCMNGQQGLVSVKECCAAELRSIDFYLLNSEEDLLKAVARLEKLDEDKIEGKKDYNNKIEKGKMDQLRCVKLHGQSGRDTDEESLLSAEHMWRMFCT